MSWVTVLWSMVASACLTLAAVHLLAWLQRRSQWACLLFSVAAAGTAGLSAAELWMMHAATPEQFATGVRWLHVPMWAVFMALVGIVRVYLRAGRPWLAWTVCAVRTVCLLVNFLVGQNLNYLEITRLRPVPFLGESASVAEGVLNPWMILGQLSLYLFVIFAADATVTVWRRGDRSKAMTMGGSIVFFMLVGALQSALYVRGVADAPFAASLCFLGVVAAMAWELSREAIRAPQLADDLRERETHYRDIFDAAVEGMFRTSAKGEVLAANPALAGMLGYGSAEELQREVEDTARQVWAEPDERDRYVRLLEEQHAVRAYECQFKRKDGTRIWVSLSARAVPGPDGRTACFDGFVEGITERKQAAEVLRATQARLASGVDLAGLSFYEVVGGDSISSMDERFRGMFGFPRSMEQGVAAVRFWMEHVHPDDAPRIMSVHQQLNDGRLERISVEYRYRHPDGRERWIHHLAIVVKRDGAGRAAHTTGVARDITEQKLAAQQLGLQRLQMAHVARVASMGELAASLAHELNQPLTAILTNAQAAQRLVASGQPDTADIREILADIVADDQRAAEVIRRVRALLKKTDIDRKPLDLNTVIREVLGFLHTDAIIKGVSIAADLSPGPLPVVGDRVQLQQVLLNLVVNAFDAMQTIPSGERKLIVQTSRSEAHGALVEIRDSGRGIAPVKMGQLFEPFFTTKTEGLGMGLVICRSIVESHGGRICAENNPARGATFRFQLPMAGGGGME